MKTKKLNKDKERCIVPKRKLHKMIIGHIGVGKASRTTLCKVEDFIKS